MTQQYLAALFTGYTVYLNSLHGSRSFCHHTMLLEEECSMVTWQTEALQEPLHNPEGYVPFIGLQSALIHKAVLICRSVGKAIHECQCTVEKEKISWEFSLSSHW